MIRVTIEKEDAQATTRQVGTRQVREQIGYAHLPGNKYPVRIKFTVPEGHDTPYLPGDYQIAPESVRVGKYEKLELNPFELFLISVTQSVKAVS